jgi:hypothetical protein
LQITSIVLNVKCRQNDTEEIIEQKNGLLAPVSLFMREEIYLAKTEFLGTLPFSQKKAGK